MAGDWIPVRTDLHSTPEVLRLARLLGRSTDEIVGLLVRFWGWAQTHTDDGALAGVDLEDAASGSHVPSRVLGALLEVGWLTWCPEAGLRVPNFGRWMSRSARARFLARDRKRRERSGRDPPDCHGSVTLLSRCGRDKSVTTEQNSTEDARIEVLGSSKRATKKESDARAPAKPA
jgi:hypothetical protein